MLNRLISSVFLLLAFALCAQDIFACACCAEPGTYYLRTARPDKFTIDLVSEFRFADRADIYMTEAGFDGIHGLEPLRKEDAASVGMIDLASTGSFANRTWRIGLRTPKGLSANYTLPLPLRFTEHKLDIHDTEDRPNGPLLYKELRFEGTLSSATGFASGGFRRGTRYMLVFQGRGSGCNEVEDYTHWRLAVHGPKAAYAFYGKLASGRASEPAGDEQP